MLKFKEDTKIRFVINVIIFIIKRLKISKKLSEISNNNSFTSTGIAIDYREALFIFIYSVVEILYYFGYNI